MATAEDVGVAIIGGGQAGLATNHELTKAGIEHVVLERGRLGSSLLCGVGEDAAVVARQLVAARSSPV